MDKILNKEVLEEYGFEFVESKSKNRLSVFTKNNIDITLSDSGSVYYSNLGFDYILKTEDSLKKLYKELRREELNKK